MNINKILAVSILGLGLSGAALITSVPMLFNSAISGFELLFAACSVGACAMFTVLALVVRKRLNTNIKE